MNILKIDGNTYIVEIDGAIEVVAVPEGADPFPAITAALVEAAEEREPTYIERRLAEYPTLREQLDMQSKDFEGWKRMIAGIKARNPKPAAD